MTNIYQFMSDSPFLTFFLAMIACSLLSWPFKLILFWIRHRNIAVSGWPPEYLDADGDFKTKEDEE